MRKKTNEEFLADVSRVKGDLYTPLEEYKKSSIHMQVRHNICGKSFPITPNSLLRNKEGGCPHCFGNKAKQKTNEQFLAEVDALVGDEYTFIEPYVNRTTPITAVHSTCGKPHKFAPGNFLLGMRCKHCINDGKRLTLEEAQIKIHEAIGLDFIIVGDYVNMQTPVDVLHTTCGNVSNPRLTDIVHKGVSCKHCSMSNGEKLTKSVLDEQGYKYEVQKTFDDLRNINKLSYDFYLPDLHIAIEYQGEQHFRPKNFGGSAKDHAEKVYELQQMNDGIKRAYAKKNNITLIEIPYTCNTLSKVRAMLSENIK